MGRNSASETWQYKVKDEDGIRTYVDLTGSVADLNGTIPDLTGTILDLPGTIPDLKFLKSAMAGTLSGRLAVFWT